MPDPADTATTPEGIPIGLWLIRNGFTLQDFPEIDSGFFLDPHYYIYDADLSQFGPYTALALGPNFRNVKGNAQYIADELGIQQGQRGMILDRNAINGYERYGFDPREFTINRFKHEAHHSRNDGHPAIIESLAYAFGDGRKINGRDVPFRLDEEWIEIARALADERDLWDTVENPRMTSSTFYNPEKSRLATPRLLDASQNLQNRPQRPITSRLALESTSRLMGR